MQNAVNYLVLKTDHPDLILIFMPGNFQLKTQNN
jgi:hypothetical protein